MTETRFDLVAIGGGSAGLGAVRAAAREGRSAALISDGPLGGDCTFTGCVPSKALLAASARGADFAQAMQHVQSVIGEVAALENAEVLTSEGVTVIAQRATFVNSSTLQVGDDTVVADNIVVASNIHGIKFTTANHASRFGRIGTYRNTHHVTVAGKHGFLIKQMNTEQPGAGQTSAQTGWQTLVSDVTDPNNLGTGDITYWVVIGGVGAVDTFTKNGGTGIRARRIGSSP
jgi:thioredoxin reductase